MGVLRSVMMHACRSGGGALRMYSCAAVGCKTTEANGIMSRQRWDERASGGMRGFKTAVNNYNVLYKAESDAGPAKNTAEGTRMETRLSFVVCAPRENEGRDANVLEKKNEAK